MTTHQEAPIVPSTTVQVRITESVMWDLQSREVVEEYGIPEDTFNAGTFTMTVKQATDLADDAEYQADCAGGCGESHTFGERSAYLAMAKRIKKTLAQLN